MSELLNQELSRRDLLRLGLDVSIASGLAAGVYIGGGLLSPDIAVAKSKNPEVGPKAPTPYGVPTRIFGASFDSERWHGGNVYASEVMYDGGKYKMWYGGQNRRNAKDTIHYAESANGYRWKKYGVVMDTRNPVNMHDGKPSFHVNDPSILKIGSRYAMWYTDYNPGIGDEISQAQSSDGRNWIKDRITLKRSKDWMAQGPARPSVIFDQGKVRMWFDSSDRTGARFIGYSESVDLANWTDPILVKKEDGSPLNGGAVDVKKYNGKHFLVHETWSGTNLALSTDGMVWKDYGLWIPKSTNRGFDPWGHITPHLFMREGRPEAVYIGGALQNNANRNSIGMVRLRGNELDRFL